MTKPVLRFVAPVALLLTLCATSAVPALAAGGGGGGGRRWGRRRGHHDRQTASAANRRPVQHHDPLDTQEQEGQAVLPRRSRLSPRAIARPMPRSTNATIMPLPSRSSRRSVTTISPMWPI